MCFDAAKSGFGSYIQGMVEILNFRSDLILVKRELGKKYLKRYKEPTIFPASLAIPLVISVELLSR